MAQDPLALSALAEQLKTVPMFASLGEPDRRAIAGAASILEASPGDVLLREGTASDGFLVLLSGEATVSIAADPGADAIEVGIVRPGETLGELGALLATPRAATVVALRACRLLRLDAATVEGLFATCPRFAVALNRELAQRLKRALAMRNETAADSLPDKVVLDAPDVTRHREYMVSYYASALRNLVRQHRLVLDRRFPAYETPFTLTVEEHARWLDLFGTRGRATPFTYHSSVATMALMRVVGDVGVNFRNLMHLKCEMGIAPGRPIEPGIPYRLVSQIEDIVALRDDRVALVCSSRVFDASGFRVRTYRDTFVILHLDPEYVQALRDAKAYGRSDAAEFQGLAAREAQLFASPGAQRVAIDVPEGMGLSYGRVSGDLNPVHTTRLAAKVFGHPRPFIQGLCTANLVLRHLTAAYSPPEGLRITFSKRVFDGQRIELLHLPGQFEVCDAEGSLLAFGDFDLPLSTSRLAPEK